MLVTNDAEQFFGAWNYPLAAPNEEDIRICKLTDWFEIIYLSALILMLLVVHKISRLVQADE